MICVKMREDDVAYILRSDTGRPQLRDDLLFRPDADLGSEGIEFTGKLPCSLMKTLRVSGIEEYPAMVRMLDQAKQSIETNRARTSSLDHMSCAGHTIAGML